MQVLAAASLFQLLLAAQSQDPFLDYLKNNASAVGILAFLVVALMRGWLVTGREADELRTERDRALDLVYKQADLTSAALQAGAAIAGKRG
jgi:hypothetical protein